MMMTDSPVGMAAIKTEPGMVYLDDVFDLLLFGLSSVLRCANTSNNVVQPTAQHCCAGSS